MPKPRREAMQGCKCRECFTLAEYLLEETGTDFGLPRAKGHDYVDLDPCTGSLTCTCQKCEKERAKLIRLGPKRVQNPWEVRPARRAA